MMAVEPKNLWATADQAERDVAVVGVGRGDEQGGDLAKC